MEQQDYTPEQLATELRQRIVALQRMGRTDLILRAVGSPMLEELHVEAARARSSRLVITADYRFLLPDLGREVILTPIHKAVYLLFLYHSEGIELKRLGDYRDELYRLYQKTSNRMDLEEVERGVERLVNPLDNAINEKCSRIKKAFTDIMDSYMASYYIISSRQQQQFSVSGHVWFVRRKVINLPRELVEYQFATN